VVESGSSEALEQYEARRWHVLVDLFLDHLPEIRPEPPNDVEVLSPGRVWTTISLRLLDADFGPADDVWIRLLGLVEVVIAARHLL
jgi:hypothetical protein